jgi:hypothetical protein
MDKEEAVQAEETVSADGGKRTRERSTITFPYGDLDDAVQVANAVHGLDGMAEMDQIAKSLDHENVDSGTFRVKVAAARIFGLIKIKDEQASLTDLGNQIVRPDTEAKARALAFIEVPLYRKIYDRYKGKLLPGDAALEADMVEFGVAEKQKNRARQGFRRSAEQAKLDRDRLVMPAGVSLDSTTPNGGASRKVETERQRFTPSGDTSPVLAFLLKSLPPTGSQWSDAARQEWMRMLNVALDEMYKPFDEE